MNLRMPLLLPPGRKYPAGPVPQRVEHFPGFAPPHSVHLMPPGPR